MSDKLLQLFHKHDRYKFPKPNMARNLSDIFPVESDKLFNTDKVENVVNEILDFHIEEAFVYKADECSQLCITVSEEIRKAVKDLDFKRYKIICLVQIFERKNQSINSVARFLCDSERDRYVVVKKEHKSAYIIVSVYGFYYP